MYHRKYSQKQKQRIGLLILIALAITSMGIGSTVAFLSASVSTNNGFGISPMPTITVNDDYTISVEAGYEVYVRAEVVITWQDQNGNILGQVPVENVDYEIAWNRDGGWFEQGGIWYYGGKVGSYPTSELIHSFKTKDTKSGYKLQVELLVQAIQAAGSTDEDSSKSAVLDAWGLIPSSNAMNP